MAHLGEGSRGLNAVRVGLRLGLADGVADLLHVDHWLPRAGLDYLLGKVSRVHRVGLLLGSLAIELAVQEVVRGHRHLLRVLKLVLPRLLSDPSCFPSQPLVNSNVSSCPMVTTLVRSHLVNVLVCIVGITFVDQLAG